jgi:fatty acid desaturase
MGEGPFSEKTSGQSPFMLQPANQVHDAMQVGAGLQVVQTDDYAELKQLLKASTLLDRQPAIHALRILITLAMLSVGLIVLAAPRGLYSLILDAVFLGFAYTQVAFLVHDAGHGQIARTVRGNNLIGLLFSNLLLGASFSWWVGKHNKHHRDPNRLGEDPDLALATLAFTPEQARQKAGVLKYIVRHQAYLFVLLLLMEGFAVRVISLKHLMRKRGGQSALEGLLMAVHFLLYSWLVFSRLNILSGLAFIAAHQMLFGLYLGSVFAPNHKGMPVIEAGNEITYMHQQALTSRNVKGNAFIDFWYGGLNYQIEHHLFPIISRNKIKRAQIIISDFCDARGIPYRAVGMLESYREVFSYLHRVSSPLRTAEPLSLYDGFSPQEKEEVRDAV